VRSRLNVRTWEEELEGDEDSRFLLAGVSQGFHIIEPDSNISSVETRNHKSATNPEVRPHIEKLIRGEIDSGHYVVCEIKPTIVSALGAVPKSDGGYRLIHDCSLPEQGSVNSYAPVLDKYSYESVDTAVAMLRHGYYMAKVDIKSAYRHIPIHPVSQKVTGLHWTFSDGTDAYFYDAKLCFGARAAPQIFHRISQAVKRMMARRGYNQIVAFQDDFLVIGQSYEECLEAWLVLINILLKLGFDINYKKLVAPCTCLVFLGIQLDTNLCQIALPEEKLVDIRSIIASFLRRKRASKRQLQTLAGKLNFAAKVVRGGRTFLRRILNCIQHLRRPHHKAVISAAAQMDLQWWNDFMSDFNGVASFYDRDNVVPILTDACGIAAGGFCNGDFVYSVWEADMPEMQAQPINYKEAVSAASAIIRWAPRLSNRSILVYTDNQCAASIINKCACRSECVMSVLREMFWTVSRHNCDVHAVYMPGERHVIADTISRLHEPGELLHLESLMNEWSLCHCGLEGGFAYYSLCDHMSLASMGYILNQVQHWQRLRRRWIEPSYGTVVQHTRTLQRLYISHTSKAIWTSVIK